MAKITGYNRNSQQTITTLGGTFSIPPSEDFTDGTWNSNGSELCLSEIGINETDNKAYVRIGNNINQFSFVGGVNGNNLSQTLAIGNNSGTYSIIMGTATTIKSLNGGGQIELDSISNGGGPGSIYLSTDSGGYAETGMFLEPGNGAYIYSYDGGIALDTNSSGILLVESGSDAGQLRLTTGWLEAVGGAIFIKDNSISSVTSSNTNKASVSISSQNSSFQSGIYNSVILGGYGIIATHSNSVYVPDLYIQSGKSIKSLNGGGQIDLDFMSMGFLALSTDNGTLAESYIILGTNSWFTGSDTNYLQSFAGNLYLATDGLNNISGNIVSIGASGTVSISSSTGDIKLVTDTGKSVEISTGTSIKSSNGGGQIDLDAYGKAVSISTDNGALSKAYVYLEDAMLLLGGTETTISGDDVVVRSGSSFVTSIPGSIQLESGTYSTYVQGLQFRKSTITNSSATSSTIATIPMVDGETITIEAKVNAVCTYPNRNYGARLMAVFLKYGGTIYQTGTTDIVAKDGFGDGTTTTIDTDGTNVRIRVTNGSGVTTRWVTTYDYLQSS